MERYGPCEEAFILQVQSYILYTCKTSTEVSASFIGARNSGSGLKSINFVHNKNVTLGVPLTGFLFVLLQSRFLDRQLPSLYTHLLHLKIKEGLQKMLPPSVGRNNKSSEIQN